MFVYQKIHIDSLILEKINYEIANLDVDNFKENFNYLNIDDLKKSCPNLFKWLYLNNTNPVKVAVIITKPNLHEFDSSPHIDTQTNCLALNFPIKNCENSETIFYNSKTPLEKIVLKKPNGVVYTSLKNKDWVKLKSYTLDSATLLNTHVPHKIINRNNDKRIVLSIRFDPDPWELTK